MKNRVFSLLLAVLLFLGSGTLPQQAMASGEIAIGNVSGAKGERVETTVTLKSDDVCSGNFNLHYSPEELELVSAESVFAFGVLNVVEPGRIRVSFASTTVLTDTVLCRLVFRITADTPAAGSAITCESLRLYNADSTPTTGSVTEGSVGKNTVCLGLAGGETAEYQAVSLDVRLSGALTCAGGNFTVTYDPACFEVKSVQSGEGLTGVNFTYRVETPGTLRVAFSSASGIPGPLTLCRVILQTVTGQEQTSSVALSEVRVYDENSQSLDVTLFDSNISIKAPSDRDPKLWVVGGALEADGTATIGVVLQGRGSVCGGAFTLRFDEGITAEVIDRESGVVIAEKAGVLGVSWGSAVPYPGETQLLTLRLSGAAEGAAIDFDAVRLYDEEGANIDVVDVRPSAVSTTQSVTALVDEVTVSAGTDGATRYDLALDIADVGYYDGALAAVTPVFALYQGNRLVSLTTAGAEEAAFGDSGVAELTLSAETKEEVTEVRVFLLDADDGTLAPLCAALRESIPAQNG